MRRTRFSLAFAAPLFSLIVTATPARAEQATPLQTLPYSPGLDTSSMDRTADPCTDFYQYSCGGWIRNNPIPADQSSWSVYGKLYQENQRFLWGILDSLSAPAVSASGPQRQLGDYFSACMDESAIDKAGIAPLQTVLADIDGLKSKADLPALLGRLHLASSGGATYFGFGSNQDFADSSQVIAFADAGGLSLPDRDYYLKSDKRSKVLRSQYLDHVTRMLELAGETPGAARRDANTVLEVETVLARASLTVVDKRDPYKLFHKVSRAQLQELTPGFDWLAYLQALGAPVDGIINVSEPKFYKALGAHWRAAPLQTIQTYLRWHAVHALAPTLNRDLETADFDFFSKTLLGVPEMKPRWKRCVALADAQLGESLGQEFVARAFSPELKARTLRMTDQIVQAMRQEIDQIDWMGTATKAKAIEKLKAVVSKIGYPDRWRDYSSIAVVRGDFAGNVLRATQFENRRQLEKIGKPLDRAEWGMTPPTVNAYYNGQMNDINFPAGILQPPLFDPRMDDAPNYGNTGGTIGHELTHGFDDEGRKFDAAGNLKDWWTRDDERKFKGRAQCIVNQFAKYTVVDDIKINSRLTLGEDMADLGGMVLAWTAWKMQTAGQPLESRDGLTPEQRFFVGFAQWACENNRPETLRVQAATDPHSPGRYRVNGVAVNLPEFAKAFACKPGAAMVAAKPCKVW